MSDASISTIRERTPCPIVYLAFGALPANTICTMVMLTAFAVPIAIAASSPLLEHRSGSGSHHAGAVPSFLVVTLDTTRAGRLGPYASDRHPAFNALAPAAADSQARDRP